MISFKVNVLTFNSLLSDLAAGEHNYHNTDSLKMLFIPIETPFLPPQFLRICIQKTWSLQPSREKKKKGFFVWMIIVGDSSRETIYADG